MGITYFLFMVVWVERTRAKSEWKWQNKLAREEVLTGNSIKRIA
jgi:hypothetical protein